MVTTNQSIESQTLSFKAKTQTIGSWTIVQLPENVSEKLSSRGQVAVKATINGHDFQQVLEPDGRWGHWFKIDKKIQSVINASSGDTLKIQIEPTKEWPEPNIPKDFQKALENAPSKIQELWTKITPMARWEWVRWINATNSTETRERRVEVSISKMKSGKRRPCCFNLAACTDPDLSRSGRLMEPSKVLV